MAVYLAHLYKLKGDATRSTASFERALKVKPDDLSTLVWLGSAIWTRDAPPTPSRSLRQHFPSLRVRSLYCSDWAARRWQSRITRAVDYLEQALTLDRRRWSFTSRWRWPTARWATSKAEAHLRVRGPGDIRPPDPLMQELDALLESAVAYEVRGAQALDESNWVAAAEYFRKGVALAPNEPSLRHKLGTALAMSGDPHAVDQFEEVTRRWPKFAKAQYSLGLMMASSGRSREAIEHFSAAVKSDPAYSEARLQLAEALRASGRFQESLPQYQETITLNPRLAEARLGYGMALAGLKRFDAARKQFDDGARIFPDRREFAEALSSVSAAGSSR